MTELINGTGLRKPASVKPKLQHTFRRTLWSKFWYKRIEVHGFVMTLTSRVAATIVLAGIVFFDDISTWTAKRRIVGWRMMDLEDIWKHALMAKSLYHPSICLHKLRKTTKILCQDIQYAVGDEVLTAVVMQRYDTWAYQLQYLLTNNSYCLSSTYKSLFEHK
jgi:hypothetical protein